MAKNNRIIVPDGNLVDEASVYGEDVVATTPEIDKATGKMAENSVKRGPLGSWWAEGVKRVRIVK